MRLLLGLLAALVLAAGTGVAFTWAPDRPVDALKARWAPPPSAFMRVDGVDAHVRDQGRRDDPLPIVLIHGTSASLHTWEPWVATLARERRVVTMDIPAFGLTGPREDADYSLAAYVRFIAALLDALKLQRVVLGGNSLGGEIAWQVAAAHPQRIAALVLVDAAGFPFTPKSLPIGFQIARTPALSTLMQNTLPRALVESSVRNVYGDPNRVSAELVDRYYELTLRAGNRKALGQRFAAMKIEDPTPLLTRIAVPTLVIWGGQDRLIPPEHAQSFGRAIAASTVVVFEKLGHVPHEEGPAETLAALRSFLEKIPAPS